MGHREETEDWSSESMMISGGELLNVRLHHRETKSRKEFRAKSLLSSLKYDDFSGPENSSKEGRFKRKCREKRLNNDKGTTKMKLLSHAD